MGGPEKLLLELDREPANLAHMERLEVKPWTSEVRGKSFTTTSHTIS